MLNLYSWSPQYFAHAPTAMLSGHVQNIVVIYRSNLMLHNSILFKKMQKVLKSPCETAHGACWALWQQLPGTLVTGKKSSFKQCCFFSILPFIGHLHLFISAFAGNVEDFLIYRVCVCVWIVCIVAQLWCHLKAIGKMVDYQYQDTFTHIQYIPWNKHMGLLSLGLVKS